MMNPNGQRFGLDLATSETLSFHVDEIKTQVTRRLAEAIDDALAKAEALIRDHSSDTA